MGNPDQPDLAALQSSLTADAVTLRNACAAIMTRWQYVKQLGEETTGESVFTGYNRLATVAQVYYGQVAQPEEFDFDDALALARRGQ